MSSFYSDKVIVSVVQEEFFSLQNLALGKDSDAMVAVHHDDLYVAVWFVAVVGESDFVAFACGVDHVVLVQVKDEAAAGLFVDHLSTRRFFDGNFLAAVLLQERAMVKKYFPLEEAEQLLT